MSLSENFNKKIELSRQIINPLLDNLNEELINKKKEAYFTNAQCITSITPLEFYFGFCFFNYFNVIFYFKDDSLNWTAYSCVNKSFPIHSGRDYKITDYLLIISDIENTLIPFIPNKYFEEMKSDNYIAYTIRLNFITCSGEEFSELKRAEQNDNFKTTDECLDFMIEEVKKHAKFRQYKFIEISSSIYNSYKNNYSSSIRYGEDGHTSDMTHTPAETHTHKDGKIHYNIPAEVFKNNLTTAGDFQYDTDVSTTYGLTATLSAGESIFWKLSKTKTL